MLAPRVRVKYQPEMCRRIYCLRKYGISVRRLAKAFGLSESQIRNAEFRGEMDREWNTVRYQQWKAVGDSWQD